MQVLKENVRNHIVAIARQQFAQKGFTKTSMREIAGHADIVTGNIYHYFLSKDELFREVLRPVLTSLERMLQQHHGKQGEDILLMTSEGYLKACVDEYVTLIHTHRELMKILLFQAQGSSLERFKEEYTDRSTGIVKEWFASMQRKHPGLRMQVPDFVIHLHSVWMFTLFEEILMHSIDGEEMESILHDYILLRYKVGEPSSRYDKA